MIKNFFYLSLLAISLSNAMEKQRQIRFGDAIRYDRLEEAQIIWAGGGIDINGLMSSDIKSIYTALGGLEAIEVTYLFQAVGGSERLVQFLLDQGADPNKIVDGRSPLLKAIIDNKKNNLTLLLERGGIVTIKMMEKARNFQPALVPLLEAFQKTKSL